MRVLLVCLAALAVVAGVGFAMVSFQPSGTDEPLQPIRVQAPHKPDPSGAQTPPTAAPAPQPRHAHAGPPDVPPPPPAIQTINPPAPAPVTGGGPRYHDGDEDWDDDDWDDDGDDDDWDD